MPEIVADAPGDRGEIVGDAGVIIVRDGQGVRRDKQAGDVLAVLAAVEDGKIEHAALVPVHAAQQERPREEDDMVERDAVGEVREPAGLLAGEGKLDALAGLFTAGADGMAGGEDRTPLREAGPE